MLSNRILNIEQTFIVPYIKQVEKNAVRKLTTNLTNWASSTQSKNQQLEWAVPVWHFVTNTFHTGPTSDIL